MAKREEAGLPRYPELRWVTLVAMRGLPMPASNADIDEAVADTLGLTEHQRAMMHVNGRQTELAYRVAWARTALNVAGAIQDAGRSLWRTTPEAERIDAPTINTRYDTHLEARKRERLAQAVNAISDSSDSDDEEEVEIEQDWKALLLDRLMAMTPAAFERLTAHLLRVAGIAEPKVIGRSGDGGIDGVGMYRPTLISFPIYFQCKRYRGSVAPSQVRDFRGAMAGRGSHGLLITTGTFSKEAEREASRDGAVAIDLVNGDDLCDLLREYELGVKVTQRVVEDVEIQQPFFEQFEEAVQ